MPTISCRDFVPLPLDELTQELRRRAPRFDLAASQRSWIQVARTGAFVSTRYGNFDITPADLRTMVHNITSITPLAPTRLPIDYDHLSMNPRNPGDGKAAGWFTGRMEPRRSDNELWAEIEWTPTAAAAIADREYQFVSPSFVKDYRHKDGRKIGTTLLAAAITNHPFLEGMAPLSLSADWAVPIHLARGENPMSTMLLLTLADGSQVEVDQSAVDAIPYVQDLKTKAEAPVPEPAPAAEAPINASMVEAMANQVQSLSAQVEALTQRSKTAEARAADLEVEGELTQLAREGKLPKVQREWAKRYALSDRDGFTAWKATLQAVTRIEHEHGSGDDTPAVIDGDAAGKQLIDLANDYAKTNNVTVAAAMNQMSTDHPELAEAYRRKYLPGE